MSNRIRKLRSFKTKEKYVPIQKESVTWKYVPIENRKLGMETKGFKLKFKNREIEKEKDYENEKTIEN